MTWNYRVVEFTKDDETWHEIREVYYNAETGEPRSHGESCVMSSEGNRGLIWILESMNEALTKPVLKDGDF